MPKIRWKTSVNITIYQNEIDSYIENIKKGEIENISIIKEKEKTIDIQFGNGDIAYNISKNWFEKV